MQVYNFPGKEELFEILKRPSHDQSSVYEVVKEILKEVKEKGDEALQKFTRKFDGNNLTKFEVTEEEINNAQYLTAEELKKAIQTAKENIEKFHSLQITPAEEMETMPGVKCWRRSVPIEKVALYIPGGSAPLFSTLLMLGIPAKLAGCKDINVLTPADNNGKVHSAILYTASILGIKKIFKVGGAQAIAAAAYGTEVIPKAYKIFGPGNQYVTIAKSIVQSEGVAIDMLAGPSEVMIIADDSAYPEFVASDLLSQAEHGPDSQVILITTSAKLASETLAQINIQLKELPRQQIAEKALQNSKAIIVDSIKEAVEITNEYAPEHLIICCDDDILVAEQVINAGSVFLGNFSPESVGDYASGTNHTLPTNGYSKAYSGVSVDSFLKKISFQKITRAGLQNIGETVITMAEAESLQAHANAISIRLKNIERV
jgi:histidinol dehydrogenase